MKLEDFIPEQPEFKLKQTGKTYRLRLPNLEDRVAMVRICGSEEGVKEVFEKQKWPEICKIIYRLMEDKTDFPAFKETVLTDDGIEETRLVIGPIMLMRALKTRTEAIGALAALNAALTHSEPEVRAYVESEIKKKALEANLELQSTGENSLT